MGFDNEYEFVPLKPITHNSLPEEMKDFISTCGMMGIMPGNNYINSMQRELAKVIDLECTNEDMDGDEYEYEDNVERNVEEDLTNLSKNANDNFDVNYFNEKNNDECMRVDRIMDSIESNNTGILKFLEVNGMPHDKAKKFVRRVVRLSIRYNK